MFARTVSAERYTLQTALETLSVFNFTVCLDLLSDFGRRIANTSDASPKQRRIQEFVAFGRTTFGDKEIFLKQFL